MGKIKTKEIKSKSIKSLNKIVAWTERVKDPIQYVNRENNEINTNKTASEYGTDKIKYVSNRVKDEALYITNNNINKTTNTIKDKIINKKQTNKKVNETNEKSSRTIKNAKKNIKTSNNSIENIEKNLKEIKQKNKKLLEQCKKIAIESSKKAKDGVKKAAQATVSAIKGIIAGLKSLVAMIAAGGGLAIITIIIICLVGLLVTSVFGIFFSSEKSINKGLSMSDVVSECNQEFSDKLNNIQNQNVHDEYILEGEMASWKDILLIYSVKQSNGINEQEVITMDENKKQIIKNIFWDMNSISSEVKTEMVEASKVDTSDTTESSEKIVLHIYIKRKTADEMTKEYNFNSMQIKQYNELSNEKYSNLLSGAIYGYIGSGEFINWRQKDPKWSNIRMGNSSGSIGNIGCLVTSIAILIEKSGCNTIINPFNPGIFVEELNKHNGFSNSGNLQYAAINKVVPNFKYVGNKNLRDKSKEEKLSIIKQYLNQGYYITAEVKGATPGHQHWVAVISVEDNDVMMVDPGSNQTIMWNAYNYVNTSQFNYFKIQN